jgi:hypothetical protein
MLQSRHICVADYPNGKTETLYQGASLAGATAAQARAVEEAKAESVMIFSHPQPLHVRYPMQEKVARQARVELDAEAEQAIKHKATLEATEKRKQAQKLLNEAKKLESTAQNLE